MQITNVKMKTLTKNEINKNWKKNDNKKEGEKNEKKRDREKIMRTSFTFFIILVILQLNRGPWTDLTI